MKSVGFISLIMFFIALPEYSQQSFWRCSCPTCPPATSPPTTSPPTTSPPTTSPPTLPSNPNSPVYQKLQKIPTPQKTAQSILDNFVGFKPGSRGKRGIVKEDIVIVLDSSGSIGSCEFDEGRKAMVEMMNLCREKYSGTTNECLYSTVRYSSYAREIFRFLPLAQAKPKMTAIHYNGGSTDTSAGLNMAATIMKAAKSARSGAERNVLLVTDGQSNDRKATIASAKSLKTIPGVKVFVVAIGRYINGIDEMANVATYPPEHTVFRVEKLSKLTYVIDLALKKINPRKYGPRVTSPKSLCSTG